ncbi:MAG: HD domain-containing protein [Elusimicrobiaceae bacterium]|nr:HD domain-containing protein [Elusimicrobiaceae bacterium]
MADEPKLVRKRPTKDEVLASAFYYAVKAHEYQVRKGTGLPYIEHPVRVAALLMEMRASSDMVAAGFLHDVVEDTDRTAEELARMFGPAVAKLVTAVSENKGDTWDSRKQKTLRALRTADYTVVRLVLADKLDNIRSIADDFGRNGENVWLRFSRPFEKQRWYYKGLARVLKLRTKHHREYRWTEEFCALVKTVFKQGPAS